MKNFIRSLLVIASLLAGIVSAAPMIMISPPGAAAVGVGNGFSLDIWWLYERPSDAVPTLGAFDIDIRFNPALVSFTSAEIGDPGRGGSFLDTAGLGSVASIGAAPGAINLFELSLDPSAELRALHPDLFVIARLFFQANSAGTAEFFTTIASVSDDLGAPLDVLLPANPAVITIGSVIPDPPTSVPEPSTVWLMLTAGLLVWWRASAKLRSSCTVLGILTLAPAAQASYVVELASPPSVVTQVTSGPYVNNRGFASFTGIAAADGTSRLFFWDCDHAAGPCLPAAAITTGAANREFLGAALNDEASPRIVSRDRVTGAPPGFFLRRYEALGGTSTVVGRSTGSAPQFGSVTSFSNINNSGDVIASSLNLASTNPLLQVYKHRSIFSGPPDSELVFPNGTILRPQAARDSDKLVVRSAIDSILLLNTSLEFLGSVAGPASGFTNLGALPGISADASTVGFAGDRAGSRGVFVAVKADGVTCSQAVAVSPGGFCIYPVAAQGAGNITDLAGTALTRVAVSSRTAPAYTPSPGLQVQLTLVHIVFVASGRLPGELASVPAREGIWSVDLLTERRTTSSGTKLHVRGVSAASPLARDGDAVGGMSIAAGGFSIVGSLSLQHGADATLAQDDLLTPVVGFSALTSTGSLHAFRARRTSSVPASSGLMNFRQRPSTNCADPSNWGCDLLGNGTVTVGSRGCMVTSVADILNSMGIRVNPRQLNRALRQESFTRTASNSIAFISEPEFVATAAAQLSVTGFATADLLAPGVQAFASRMGVTDLGFFVLPDVPAAHPAGSPAGHIGAPAEQTTINGESLSPLIDFMNYNGQAVIVKVANCKNTDATCGFHFLVGKGKDVVNMAGDPVRRVTEFVNDPGAIAVTNLAQEFLSGTTIYKRKNRAFGVRAYLRRAAASVGGAITPQSFTALVQSPLEVVATDPQNRRIGFDPVLRQTYADIVNAAYVNDAFQDFDGPGGTDAKLLWIGSAENAYGEINGIGDGVLEGDYNFELVGTGTGPFTVVFTSSDASGKAVTRKIRGNISAGNRESVRLTRRLGATATLAVFRPAIGPRALGDIDYNGMIDIDDVNEITPHLNTLAQDADDPRDLDRDGKITAADSRKLVTLCTKLRCAR